MRKRELFFISLWFYISWFGCAFLAKTEWSWASFLFPMTLILFMISKKSLNSKEFALALIISLGGVLFDSTMIGFGFIKVLGESFFLIPYWLISIWLLFSFSMIKLGRELKISFGFAAVLGFFGGPLSYQSGEFLKVLTFINPLTMIVYAGFWAILFPLIFILSRRLT